MCCIQSSTNIASANDTFDIIDYSLNEARQNKKNSIVFASTDILEKRRREIEITQAVSNAIINSSFKVYFQPIYSLKEKRYTKMEALVRLIDENLGFIPPDEFIPIAEKNGDILAIGEIVLEKVCAFIEEYHPEDYGIKSIHVNLSVVQCMQENIGIRLLNIIDKYWTEHINTMSHLREGIHLRSYGQEDPLRAYTVEGFDLFAGAENIEHMLGCLQATSREYERDEYIIQTGSTDHQTQHNSDQGGGGDEVVDDCLGAGLAGEEHLVEGEDEDLLTQNQHSKLTCTLVGEQQGKQRKTQHTCFKAGGQEGRQAAFYLAQPQNHKTQRQGHTAKHKYHRGQHQSGFIIVSGGKGRKQHKGQGDIDHQLLHGIDAVPGQELGFPGKYTHTQRQKHRQRRLQNRNELIHYLITPFCRMILA